MATGRVMSAVFLTCVCASSQKHVTEAVVENHRCAKSTERHPTFSEALGDQFHRKWLLLNDLRWNFSDRAFGTSPA
jgi:hypothetical protein